MCVYLILICLFILGGQLSGLIPDTAVRDHCWKGLGNLAHVMLGMKSRSATYKATCCTISPSPLGVFSVDVQLRSPIWRG